MVLDCLPFFFFNINSRNPLLNAAFQTVGHQRALAAGLIHAAVTKTLQHIQFAQHYTLFYFLYHLLPVWTKVYGHSVTSPCHYPIKQFLRFASGKQLSRIAFTIPVKQDECQTETILSSS